LTGCSNGKTCTNGVCSCPVATPYFTGTACVACTQDSHCTSGQVCRNNQCIAPTAVYSCPDTSVVTRCKDLVNKVLLLTPTTSPVTLQGTICTTAPYECIAPKVASCGNGNVSGIAYTLYTSTGSFVGCSTPANVTYQ
jgi:Cys-rich repeat protein